MNELNQIQAFNQVLHDFRQLKQIVHQLIPSTVNTLCITNKHKSVAPLHYCLIIQHGKIELIQKSKTSKQVTQLDLNDGVLLQDDKVMYSEGIRVFNQNVQDILLDLTEQKAAVYSQKN